MDRGILGRAGASLTAIAWLALLLAQGAEAGTTGKITGRVTDQKQQPLIAANVAVPAARTGAITDADGRYVILNVPAGTYELKVNLLGYRATTVTDVVVSSDQTTTIDVTLQEAPVPMSEVVVSAKRPVVDLKLTSTLAALSRQEIENLPVENLQDVVNLQAGVVDGHFRGGRTGEVQYQVDGVTVNNPYDNSSELKLDRSILEEVQVVSGTFDAEYGQAMSGVVNAVLRRGSEHFRWDAEVRSGAYVYQGGSRRRTGYDFNPSRVQNYQLSLSGPLPLPKTTYLVNGRRYVFDSYLQAEQRFTPARASVPDSVSVSEPIYKIMHPDGDLSTGPLGTSREWSGVAKVTNRSIANTELSYQAVLNFIRSRDANWSYRFNPDGISHKRTFSVAHGVDLTHTFSKNTFLDASIRQNYFDYRDLAFESLYDPRYDADGPGVGVPAYEYGAVVQGVEFNRFKQNTNSIVTKETLTSQITRDQQIKLGVEFEWPRLEFGTPGYLIYNATAGLERVVDQPPNYPAAVRYAPHIASAFAQTVSEWNDINVHAGVRMDYFNPAAVLPTDLANPANAITGAPTTGFRATTRKVSLSPRIALSYPVTRDAALFFAYGHFLQMPALGTIYTNADYGALRDLQASSIQYETMGNPDIKPEVTVQYQFGYRQAITDWLGLEANVYYKDIRDLLGIEFISTYNDAEYTRYTNVDFGSVIGVTVSLDQRQFGFFSSTIDYTWQRATGNSSDPRETAVRAEAGEDPRPRVIPFNWDQRHTLNLTLGMQLPNDLSTTAVVRVASGQPYTPNVETGFGTGLEDNSGRKPPSLEVDLRGEKAFSLGGLPLSLFTRVFNVFDTRFVNGAVFATTGSPYYSRFPDVDRIALADPTRFYPPRRIEVGLSLTSQKRRAAEATP